MRNFINQLGNLFMKPLLKSPLHFLVSGQLVLITFTGRKSGRTYTTPLAYMREGDTVTLFTQKSRTWWKNLQGGAAVTLQLKGQTVQGDADTFSLETADLLPLLRRMYPRMSDAQSTQLSRNVVMIQIRLRQQ